MNANVSKNTAEGVTLTAEGTLVGYGAELLRERKDDRYSPNDLPALDLSDLTEEIILKAQEPSCIV